MSIVICYYAEIALKGKNRKFFEEYLVANIKKALKGKNYQTVKRISGRILIGLKKNVETKEITEALKNVFGIAYFCFAETCEQKIEAIKEKALEMLKVQEFQSFRVETKRAKKDFSFNSQQINEQVGAEIAEKLNKKVKLKNPDITLFIAIVENFSFLYREKIAGPGGLPVGVSGKAMSLLSGGIDSPVASWQMIKRGIKIIFVHFHSYPYASQDSLEKVKKIVETLSKLQFGAKIYFVPFADIQKEILLKTKANLRIVLYRRFMFRISEILAKKEKSKALITGENVGQVASQTLDNIAAIEEAVILPILRPLAGQDKIEIIEQAKKIGTFEISILPHQDCCARFMPQHPATKANLEEVKEEEAKLKFGQLIEEAIKKSKIEEI